MLDTSHGVGLLQRADAPVFEAIEGESDAERETPQREFTPAQRREARQLVERAAGEGDSGFSWMRVAIGVGIVVFGAAAIWWLQRRRLAA